ncbi:MAG: restriction endonuclease subunit S, partial [Dehalococcoidia bacterium]
ELLTRGVPGWHTEWKQAPGIGTIPACWEVVRLGDVADVKNGTTPSKSRSDYWAEDGTPFIRTGQVNDVVIREAEQFLTPAGVAAGAVIIPRGSVLIAMIGQGKTRGMAARLDIDGAVNQNFAAVVAKPRLTGDFFFAWAGQHYDEIRGLGQGSNQGALNCGLVGSIRLPLPPKAEQQVIVALNAALADRLTGEQSALDGIIEAKSMAAAALLSGRVRVS